MFNDIIELVSESVIKNKYDEIVASNATQRTIFAQLKSIRQSEFYQAQAVGYKPEIMFVIADYLDYNNESTIIYKSEYYTVLRTYRKGIELEIVCKRGIENGST